VFQVTYYLGLEHFINPNKHSKSIDSILSAYLDCYPIKILTYLNYQRLPLTLVKIATDQLISNNDLNQV